MFNLDNIDLDIDDDFSSNLFSKRIPPVEKNIVETDNVCQKKRFSDCNSLKYDMNNPTKERFYKQTDSNVKLSSKNFLELSLAEKTNETSLKRSFVEGDTPPKKRRSREGLLKRKFPGPAGLLPDRPFEEIHDLHVPVENPQEDNYEKNQENVVLCSQYSGSIFLEPSYQRLVLDFNLNEPDSPLNKYTIEWVKKTALSKGMQGRKIPFLGLIIHSVNHSMPDPVLVLRDPSGEILGSLHREIWADMGIKIKGGIALALRQVGVLVTGVIRRQIYLNITMNNILSLYSPCENENEVEITSVNKVSQLELFKSFEEWLTKPSKDTPEKTSLKLPLFSTVDTMKPSLINKEKFKNEKNIPEKHSNISKKNEKKEDIFASLGIVLSDNDFSEKMNIPEAESVEEKEKNNLKSNFGQELSEADNLIFEEVLSGINLDEFEM